MANILGQPTIQEISNVMCDQCNAVICLGCPVYELDKHARAQQSVQPTGGTLPDFRALFDPEVLSGLESESTPPTIG